MGGNMENCLTVVYEFRILEDFPSYLLFRQLARFNGPQDVRNLARVFIRQETARRKAKAVAEGMADSRESEESIRIRVIRCMNNYLSLILKISEFAGDRARKEFADQDLRIIQVRTSFDFRTWLVRLLFVVDADPEAEAYFTQLLNAIEKFVLLEECFVATLIHVNTREGIVDELSIHRNYPLVVSVEADDPLDTSVG
jgi:hypothetical protein